MINPKRGLWDKTPSNINICRASETDLPFINVLMEELVEDLNNTEEINLSRLKDNYVSLINKPESKIFVAKMGKEVVGFIHLNMRQTLFHPEASGLIEELVVTKNQRNKGIGRLLLASILDYCYNSGFNEIEVSTEKTNIKAMEFYKQCGFKEFGIMLEKHW